MNDFIEIISVGLWGDNPKYIMGLIRLGQQIKKFKGRKKIVCFISINGYQNLWDEKKEWIFLARKCLIDYVEFVIIAGETSWHSTIWRYSIIQNKIINSEQKRSYLNSVIHFRDLDSIITKREENVVKKWLNTSKPFLVLKDHPSHDSWPIMAGMFSMNTRHLKEEDLLSFWNTMQQSIPNEKLYFSDQIALKECYRRMNPNTIYHYNGHNNLNNDDIGYIGEPINSDLMWDLKGRQIRQDYINSQITHQSI